MYKITQENINYLLLYSNELDKYDDQFFIHNCLCGFSDYNYVNKNKGKNCNRDLTYVYATRLLIFLKNTSIFYKIQVNPTSKVIYDTDGVLTVESVIVKNKRIRITEFDDFIEKNLKCLYGIGLYQLYLIDDETISIRYVEYEHPVLSKQDVDEYVIIEDQIIEQNTKEIIQNKLKVIQDAIAEITNILNKL